MCLRLSPLASWRGDGADLIPFHKSQLDTGCMYQHPMLLKKTQRAASGMMRGRDAWHYTNTIVPCLNSHECQIMHRAERRYKNDKEFDHFFDAQESEKSNPNVNAETISSLANVLPNTAKCQHALPGSMQT